MSAICRGRLMLVTVPNKSTFLGPMQLDPTIIREKLFRGIDEEYNVTNMGIVVEVIGQLENFQITPEILEATRLGKHVNELRRKASDRQLASRAKSLIKKWKSLLPSTPATPGGPAPQPSSGGTPLTPLGNNNKGLEGALQTNGNGASRLLHPTMSPRGMRTPLVSPRQAPRTPLVSPASAVRTPLVSPRAGAKTPLVSPRLPPISPRTQAPPRRPPPPPSTGSRTSPVLINLGSTPSSSPSHSGAPSRPPSHCATVELLSREPSPQPLSRAPSRSPSPEIIMVSSVPAKNPGSKRVRPREESPEVEVLQEQRSPQAKRQRMTNGGGAVGSPKVRRKVPGRTPGRGEAGDILGQQMLRAKRARVPTTQELVANMGIESRAASVSPPFLPVKDLVPKESEDQLMDRFFLSQRREASLHQSRPSTAASGITSSTSTGVASLEPSRGPSPAAQETVEDLMAQLPVIDSEAVLAEWRKSQEEEEEEEEVDGLIPVLRPRAEVTQQLIQDLNHEGQLEHVGGIKDHEGEFREWHEMTSLCSLDGELLHILPYSVID